MGTSFWTTLSAVCTVLSLAISLYVAFRKDKDEELKSNLQETIEKIEVNTKSARSNTTPAAHATQGTHATRETREAITNAMEELKNAAVPAIQDIAAAINALKDKPKVQREEVEGPPEGQVQRQGAEGRQEGPEGGH
ncbi:hypothetical protein N0V90_001931 [Kalmusia sp. IMI 367209]|nr:hypothetical protein N0V90_001931 [Kalmusia sp. IMI 367209]